MMNNIKTDKTQKLQNKLAKMQQDGHFQKAIELCQSALKADPTNYQLHVRLGDLYIEWHLDIYQARQYIDEAITEYQRALESDLNSPEIYCKIGIALYYKGDLDKAINYFNNAIEQDPQMAEAFYMKAVTLKAKSRYAEAVELAQEAIKYSKLKSSRSHFLLHNLFKVVYYRDFKAKLKSIYHLMLAILTLPFDKQAIKNVIKTISYLKFIPLLFKGLWLSQSRYYNQAIDLYNEAIDDAPGFTLLYSMLGDVYKAIGKYEEAINEYRMAIWFDTLCISAYKSLCVTYEEQGDYDNAINTYRKLIEIRPTDPVLYSNLANILYLKGDIKNAVANYQNAITLNPNRDWTSVIAQTLGYVFQESKQDFDAAISAYQSAYLLTPNDIDIYISLGSAFYDKGDYSNALSIYRAALELQPDNAKIHCNLGFLLWGKGDIDEAIKEYELAIKYDPTYDIAYNNLGVIYLDDLGRVSNAIDLFEQAVNYNPNYVLAYYNLARSIAIKGEKVEAARLYQIALDLNSVTNEIDQQDIKDRIDDLFS